MATKKRSTSAALRSTPKTRTASPRGRGPKPTVRSRSSSTGSTTPARRPARDSATEPTTAQAVALSNNDVAQIAWRVPAKIPNCLGFAIFRKNGIPESSATWTPLPAWVGFQGQTNEPWQPKDTTVWPVQKFSWKDVTAERGQTYSYRVVAVTGDSASEKPLTEIPGTAMVTNTVTLTPDRGTFKAYFNRGILSTQFLSHQIPAGPTGAPNFKVLTDRIDQPGDPLRACLAGDIIGGVKLLLDRAAARGGTCYAALYELTDPELLQALLAAKSLHLILSNTGSDDKENEPARQSLHEVHDDEIIDRFLASGHIGHNKFCVYVDSGNVPRAVLLGSTNWTATALCAQSNNALIVENDALAAAYLKYWKRLKADTPANGHARQDEPLRTADETPGATDVPVDNGKATVWFSPDTEHARNRRRGAQEDTPPDLKQVFDLMANAKEAIFFLQFQPGSPSVVDEAARIQNQNPNLLVRGAVTDPKAVGVFNTTLIHRPGEPPVEVAAASAVTDQFAFWQKELLKSSPTAHAIIHDKIVVIDPMTPNCVVCTGSHNNGFQASYNNDENLMIIQGHTALAQAYAVHVLDVYDHYRFRYQIQKSGQNAFSGLAADDTWQDKYFDPNNPASRENQIWF